MLVQASAQVGLVDEEVVELLAVQRDHGDALQVATVEGIVDGDVDLLEGRSDALQDGPRVVAQVAARAAVQDEAAQTGSLGILSPLA